MSDDLAEIIVCQGPPRCDLQGDDAVVRQKDGCVWCQRITVHADGTESTRGPSSDRPEVKQ